ncbi:THAP domain-containing protein 1 [Orchesella cincta]|uniref:THAP domain-containing protein 1 n=1 Tax=Orchesella cincta TaxID=48709 RepID=A0A1D2MRK0_ORCCI|nr:THAP domain-containing protein 1 [Orchesella cincta]
MVHRCCISSCGMSVRVVEAKGLSYHKFPTKEPVRDQWVQAVIPHMDKPELFKVVPRYTRVCSRHFRKKDYCMDAKKRARLNSNAVPSVFPRKNTPLVIPTILPVSPKVTTPKAHSLPDLGPLNTTASTSATSTSNVETTTSSSATFTPVEVNSSSEATTKSLPLEEILNRRELVIESATIQDDHLVLTVMDPASQGDLESVSISNSDDQSQASTSNKVDEQFGNIKRRKRRKWNRTAFARPAKGKRKSLPSKAESSLESVGDSLSDISLSKSTTATPQVEPAEATEIVNHQQQQSSSEQHSDHQDNASLNNVTLLLSELSNQSYQVASVEQELLQSIQTFSLACGGDPEDVEQNELQPNPESVSYSLNSLVPAFLHHHSSEESLFSNEESQSVRNLLEGSLPNEPQQQTLANTEDESLRFELVDLRIDPDMPSVPPPTYLDIEELAQQLNSSLFTDGKIPLFNIENLNLSTDSSSELNLGDELLSTNDSAGKKEHVVKPSTSSAAIQVEKKSGTTKKSSSQRMRTKKAEVVKPVKEKKLKGVTKRPKKDKATGKFSVERFKDSDKDIEYYTGFNSYRNFEAFFRSLEAYIERICITDVTYGVNNLPSTNDKTLCASTSSAAASETGLNQSTTPEQPKKRPCQGRAMSRINELFITIIRLRRKLPEKVLGHMFCISQPTVSRIVRAWTVLLSKIIDSYPVERPVTSASAYNEHSYTSKGLGIPDAFRDLFYSDLAKSIVVTSLSPKKVKSKTKAASPNKSHHVKKSKIEMPSSSKAMVQPNDDIQHGIDLNATPEDATHSLLSDFFFNSDPDNPVTTEQLHLFDFI